VIGAALSLVTGGSAARLAVTLLIGAALGGTGAWKLADAARHRQAADHLREAARAVQAAQDQSTRHQKAADDATAQATQRAQVNARAAAAARSELDRLRQQLAASPGSDAAACPATAERAAAVSAVFGDCARALEDMGRRADAHATDALRLWEAWPDD
jgi:hypothetical protein